MGHTDHMWRCISILALVAFLSGCGTPWLQFEDVPLTYTVKSGDTLHQVAFRYQLDPAALAQWNGIGRDARVIAGYDLRLRPPLPGQLHPVHGGAVVARRRKPETPVARTVVPTSAPQPAQAKAPAVAPVPSPVPPRAASAPVAKAPAVISAGTAGGSWPWPVDGKLVRKYGPGNDGVDIAIAQGSGVKAVAGGRVVYGGSALKGYGLLVIVQHDNEVMTAYAHTSELLVGEGQTVRAGQVIARSGVGPGQIPMLHFEVRRKGQPVDPLPWLQRPG